MRAVKYFSERSSTPIASPKNGFWVKDDVVFDVTEDSHVGFIIKYPYRFNLTKDDITLLYEHYGEPVGSEKQAREDLVRIAASQGWVRVRRYAKPHDRWMIHRRHLEKAGSNHRVLDRIMTKDATALIAGFDNEQDLHEYRWEDREIAVYLNGWAVENKVRPYNLKEVIV